MERNLLLLAFCFAVSVHRPVGAQDFELSRGYNRGTLRLEIDNDMIWCKDSNFTNGWSVQYNNLFITIWALVTIPGDGIPNGRANPLSTLPMPIFDVGFMRANTRTGGQDRCSGLP